jgi:RHS repeat-associated protein
MAKRLWLMLGALGVILLFSFGIAPTEHPAAVQADTVPYQVGDVFAGVGAGHIYQYRPFTSTIGANFVADLDTGSNSDEQTGMCFDPAGNLYSTNHYAGTMSRFNNLGVLINPIWANGFQFFPESCVQGRDGNFYVGEVSPLGQPNTPNRLHKFDAAGTQIATFNLEKGPRGIDWIDLAADNCTIYYTSESNRIMRFNVCTNTQINGVNNPWVSNLDGATGVCYALRIRPNGEVMVACANNVYRLDAAGTILQTYPKPAGEPADYQMFAMNLDPTPDSNGAWYFWTSIAKNGDIYKINIDTGVIVNQFTAPGLGSQRLMSGLAVYGEMAAAAVDTLSEPETRGDACTCYHTDKPVNTATGNFWHTFTDLALPAARGLALDFTRTYNSAGATVSGTLGYGWTSSYDMSVDASNPLTYYVHYGDGRIVPFPASGGGYPRTLAQLVHNPDGTFTLTQTHGLTRFFFDTTGTLSKIADRNNYTTTLSYSGGQLQTVTDAANRSLTFSYTPAGLLRQVSDPIGRTAVFTYSTTTGDLIASRDAGGQETHYTYYSGAQAHLLHTMQDPNQGLLTNIYDANKRVQTQTDPLQRTLQFAYTPLDALRTQTVVTDALGYTSVYTYDAFRLTARTLNPGPQQATWHYSYSPTFATAVAQVTDPLTHTWSYTWDSRGNQLSATDPLSRTTSYAYNATNDLLVITNTRGLTTTFSYDAFGNPLTVTRPVTETNDLAVARLGYDPAHPGEVLTITNPLNNSWLLVHDPTTGYVLTSTNPLTQSTRYTYDPVGRVVGMVSPRGYPSAAAYDAYDAPVRITDTLGFTTTFAYDANHNLTTITDTKGFTTTYRYNADDELIRVTRADGTHSDYAYDANGHVISQTNALTQTTRYGYDAYNRLVSVTDPLTRTTAYGYDLAGNLTVMTDALGLTTTLGYDAANQLTAITHQDPLSTPNVAFAYNLLGQRTVMTDGTGTSLYSYDSLDRLVAAQNGAQRTVGYHYDLAGQLTQLDYPGVTSGTGQVLRRYDAAGRLHEVEDWLGQTSTFDYNADGSLTQIAYGNGVLGEADYDAAGRVVAITDTVKGGATPFLALHYTRDRLGLLATAAEAGNTNTYDYDALARLQSDGLSGSTTSSRIWGYDGVTEIITTSYQVGTGTPLTTTRSYDAANALSRLLEQQSSTVTQNLTFTYDLNGNRTQQRDAVSGDVRSYTYDQANRLLTINPTALHGPLATFQYNGDGLRMEKDAISGCCVQPHAYTWDVGAGLPLLLQENATSYIYGPGGMVLEQIQDSGTTGTPYYYHADQLGSIRALTDQAGAVVATYAYDAYGSTTASTGSVANPLRYAGEYQDVESGLYYLRARYYDPASQQFLTRDPLVAATEQAYTYAAGSPLNATDPSGLDPGGPSGYDDPEFPGFWCSVLGFCSDAEKQAILFWQYRTQAAENIVRAQEQARGAGLAGPYIGGIDHPLMAAGNTVCAAVLSTGSSGKPFGETLKVGPYAAKSIPARGPERDFTTVEHNAVDAIGRDTGCHTCGTRDPGTKSGHFVPDHQPPSQLVPPGTPQELYPHCLACSRRQGGEVREYMRRAAKNQP